MVSIHGGALKTLGLFPSMHSSSPEDVNAWVVTRASDETLHSALRLGKICGSISRISKVRL